MKYEILSPSGDFDSLKAAINSGAQAVYLGLSNFNARRKASNFNESNIKEAIRLAHLHGVKVYITLNTIVKDEEYDSLIETIKVAIDAKCDAFIVQDLGVAKVLKENFKNVSMHASTQMGCNNLYSAKVLESLGFERVTLARETRLEDIKLIKENTNLEIEYFIQGALCISYSGNCYLSVFENGDSGNRGRCRQLCRFEYTNNNDKKYYLSARDQSLIKNIKELMGAGVTSFKIEGRMRHPGYVATMTSIYNKVIGSIINNTELDINSSIESLKESYSRGDYLYSSYLYGVPNDVINSEFQNHRGIRIGNVISISRFKNIYEILVESNHPLNEGDGLKFIKNNKEIASIGVGNVNKVKDFRYKIYSTRFIEPKSEIYLILNSKKENELLSYKSRIGVDVYIYAHINEPLSITIKTPLVSVKKTSDIVLSKAESRPITKEDIKNSIDRFNDTEFYMSFIEYDIEDVFIPKSVINEVRRSAISSLSESIISYNEKSNNELFITSSLDKTYIPFTYKKNIVIFSDKEIDYIKPNNDYLYIYSPNVFNYDSISDTFNSLINKGIKNIGLNQPLISLTKDLYVIDKLYNTYKDMVLLGNNLSSIYYSLNSKNVIVSNNLNSISSYSLMSYRELNVLNVVSSIESSRKYLNSNEDIYSYTIGYPVVMNFAHCPYKTVYKNDCNNCSYDGSLSYSSMKIRRYRQSLCAFEMLYSKPINLTKELNNPKLIDLREFSNSDKKMIFDYLYKGTSLTLSNETIGLIDKEVL